MAGKKSDKPAPRSIFIKRVLESLVLSLCLISLALSLGVAGYHWIAGLDWVDSFLEGAMILSGMGPVSPLTTSAAKIFAGIYALFSGVVFIGVMGLVLGPILHRTLHKFHLDEKDES